MKNDDEDKGILNFGNELLKGIDNKSDKKEDIELFSEKDPMLELRNDILHFFRAMMSTVAKKEQIKERIEASFLEDLDSEELDFQERISLYRLISNQANVTADSVLSIFKPTPGAPSLLADRLSKDTTDDDFDRAYENLKPEELQKIDKLMKMLQLVDKDK